MSELLNIEAALNEWIARNSLMLSSRGVLFEQKSTPHGSNSLPRIFNVGFTSNRLFCSFSVWERDPIPTELLVGDRTNGTHFFGTSIIVKTSTEMTALLDKYIRDLLNNVFDELKEGEYPPGYVVHNEDQFVSPKNTH